MSESSSTSSSEAPPGDRPAILRFVRRGLLFGAGALVFIYALHVGLHALYLSATRDGPPPTVLVWGDSRTTYGLDLPALGEALDAAVVSHAHPGAGVYDLLLFVDAVPENSRVLLGLDVPILRGEHRYDRSGLSPEALWQLWLADYSPSELARIAANNRDPLRDVAHRDTETHAPLPGASGGLPPISGSQKILEGNRQAPRYRANESLYLLAVRRLADKGCTVHLLHIPPSPEMSRLREVSGYADFMESFKAPGLDGVYVEDGLSLPDMGRYMIDHSHLDSVGRGLMTALVAERLIAARRPAP